MAGGGPGARELDQTPTWAVALVCAVIVLISILLEKVLHKVGQVIYLCNKLLFINVILSLISLEDVVARGRGANLN